MACNPPKKYMYAYLSNGYFNTISNFNSEKVEKSAYFQPWFDQPLTWAKITPNLIKMGVHAYLVKWVSKSILKFEF